MSASMINALTSSLRRAGWTLGDTSGSGAETILRWGGTPPSAQIIVRQGALVLAEYDAAEIVALARFEQVTPDNLARVQAYIDAAVVE